MKSGTQSSRVRVPQTDTTLCQYLLSPISARQCSSRYSSRSTGSHMKSVTQSSTDSESHGQTPLHNTAGGQIVAMLEQRVPSAMLTCRSLRCVQALPQPLELMIDVKTAKKRNRKAEEPRKYNAVWQCFGENLQTSPGLPFDLRQACK